VPLLTDIGLLATPDPGTPGTGLRRVPDAVLAWEGDRITWVGPRRALPRSLASEPSHSAGGRLVIPGLVDSHTHLAFAGWRADEFEARLLGQHYLEIARRGGGIQRTVALTRAASEADLVARCTRHLDGMAALGVTTVECKSGYGLSLDEELKLLRVYAHLQVSQPLRIVPTLLAAHVVPGEYREAREAYVDLVCDRIVPDAARTGLAAFCDVFVEESAFRPDEARTILEAGRRHGLRAKLHADQLSDGGGARLAAEMGAISADHLEHVSGEGIERLAAAGVVAVSLPLATLYLRQPPLPARALLTAGVPVAVATDFNPGTAPSYHLPLAMMLACTLQRMTPSEALCGATSAAAAALALGAQCGAIEPGFSADFAVIDAPDVDHWLYHFQANACVATWARGRRVH
jgi:imidazolonepropionase